MNSLAQVKYWILHQVLTLCLIKRQFHHNLKEFHHCLPRKNQKYKLHKVTEMRVRLFYMHLRELS